MAEYDCIVLGTGGVGSAALYHAASRGARVLGIDRFSPPHDRGSSHGDTRIIRMAYFEHPNYVPMLRRAYALWESLAQASGRHLYDESGVLQIGPPDGMVVPGVLASARQHAISVESLTATEVTQRFPGFVVPAGYHAVLEPRAGFLHVEACVAAHLQLARQHGAQFHANETVAAWSVDQETFEVRTDAATYTSDRLIIAGGAWAADLLHELAIPLTVLRKSLFWYQAATAEYRLEHGAPGFLYELPHGVFYGFPQWEASGVKVAEHSGGTVTHDPLQVDRQLDPLEAARIENFLVNQMPGVSGPRTRHEVCLYTMSPDGHFIIDKHPGHRGLAFAAGLSGHGFKFTSMLGEALVELAFDGQASTDIQFLSPQRFSAHPQTDGP